MKHHLEVMVVLNLFPNSSNVKDDIRLKQLLESVVSKVLIDWSSTTSSLGPKLNTVPAVVCCKSTPEYRNILFSPNEISFNITIEV